MDVDDDQNPSESVDVLKSSEPVQSLVAGRARRSTAGNRLAALLDQEEKDDIDLLFEENEDDNDFEAKEESDVELGSSSDEEDANVNDDELAGEKDLERESRAQRTKSRKAREAFPGQQHLKKLFDKNNAQERSSRTKRVSIQEPTATTDANGTTHELSSTADILDDRLRKKSERISWIPTKDDKPSRQSSRRQTVANKKVTHQRLKEAEERRVKTITAMNEAQSKRKTETKIWTQEMRLEQAKKTELENLSSLNKWEEMEAVRVEAQRAKLAALHARKLEGPVITMYSARAEWDETGKMVRVAKRDYTQHLDLSVKKEEKEKKKRGPKGKVRIDTDTNPDSLDTPEAPLESQPPTIPGTPLEKPGGDTKTGVSNDVTEANSPAVDVSLAQPSEATPLNISREEEPIKEHKVENNAAIETVQETASEEKVISVDKDSHNEDVNNTNEDVMDVEQDTYKDPEVIPPKEPRDPEYSSSTFIILDNFNSEAIQSRHYQSRILFPSNKGWLPSMCSQLF